jgi:16S rRNA (cytidine1402-2'-O)-methyltransferase
MSQNRGTLYLVATPIGNLEDVTRRALRVLGEADVVACEDTRRTRSLLEHFGIRARTLSYHEHNERERAEELALLIEEGRTVALVSDAGTPGVNDPGYRVVRACVERGLSVVPVPGPTAFVAALTASGLPTDEFYFGGFLPARSHARRERLASVKQLRATLVFYETPHRLAHALADALEVLGEREAAVARELTKLHEEIDRDVIDEGVAEGTPKSSSVAEMVTRFEAEGLDQRAALKRAARELGLTRDEAYRRLTSERALSKRDEG